MFQFNNQAGLKYAVDGKVKYDLEGPYLPSSQNGVLVML